jgi:hypothetical protein
MLAFVLAALLTPLPDPAARPVPCPGGDFIPDQALVTPTGPVDAIAIDGFTITLGSQCGGVVKLKPKRKGTVVRGTLRCAGGSRGRFKGLIASECQRLTGRLNVKKRRIKVAATRASATTTTTPTSTSTTTTQAFASALIVRDWAVGAASERYLCRRERLPSDLYLTAFRAAAPAGVYGTLVTVKDALAGGDAVGDYECSASIGADERGVFASGTGTGDVTFPPGYGVHLRAGEYVNLRLHLVNPDVAELDGSAGLLVGIGDASDVTSGLELVFAGTFAINLPPGSQTTETGGCTASAGFQVVALWPHMHALGVHAKLEVVHGGPTQVVHDAPYSVDAQAVYPTSTAVAAGDRIVAGCTYANATPGTVRFGDSATDEQCLIGMYRSPVSATGVYGCVSF